MLLHEFLQQFVYAELLLLFLERHYYFFLHVPQFVQRHVVHLPYRSQCGMWVSDGHSSLWTDCVDSRRSGVPFQRHAGFPATVTTQLRVQRPGECQSRCTGRGAAEGMERHVQQVRSRFVYVLPERSSVSNLTELVGYRLAVRWIYDSPKTKLQTSSWYLP